MKLNALQIQEATKGQFLVPPYDTTVFATHMIFDSREAKAGSLFVPLKGENVDGHKFIEQVIDNFASVVLTEIDLADNVYTKAKKQHASIIMVENTLRAMKDVASYWKDLLPAKSIAITGSTGKTTTRNLISDVLKSKFKITVAQKNYNNEIGLPITVCSSDVDDQMLVCEMGMYSIGEIKYLCEIVKPEWGIITNIGECHIERLGSKDNIAIAKTELAEAVSDNIGKMFLPADDDYLDFIIDRAKLKERNIDITLFGSGAFKDEYCEYNQIWTENIKFDTQAFPSFTICYKEKSASNIAKSKCSLAVQGKHNVINASAACAVGLAAGMTIEQCCKALQDSASQSGRQESLTSKFGYTIINDAYNANPQSVKASLDMFDTIDTELDKICVLGDMAELGDIALQEHKKVGQHISKMNIASLYCVGDLSKEICRAAKDCGMDKAKIKHFNNNNDLYAALKKIDKDNIILVKASNCMMLQNVIEKLK